MANLKNTTIDDTGYIKIPSGNTAQRPSPAANGMIRFNSELGVTEYYASNNWMDITTGRPPIVTNGLNLYLDTGDGLSYPGTGNTWFDLSGNGNNVTANSTYINSTALLSGVSASTATTSILNTDQHSVFFMIRFEPNGSYPNGFSGNWEKIFSYNAGGSDRSPSVWRYPSNRIIHWRFDPGNSDADFSSTASTTYPSAGTEFSLNLWYYVGVTKSGATANTYVNGTFLASRTVSSPKTSGNSAIYLFESYTLSSAKLNSVQIYNRALSATEIQQNFQALRGRYGI
jgi:Concanavalin A-like lectin/glucanases superfamily